MPLLTERHCTILCFLDSFFHQVRLLSRIILAQVSLPHAGRKKYALQLQQYYYNYNTKKIYNHNNVFTILSVQSYNSTVQVYARIKKIQFSMIL